MKTRKYQFTITGTNPDHMERLKRAIDCFLQESQKGGDVSLGLIKGESESWQKCGRIGTIIESNIKTSEFYVEKKLR